MSQSAAWEGYRPFVVVRKVPESETVTSFYLEPEDGGELPSFRPGQYLGLKLSPPDELVPVLRSYTLSDSPANTGHYRLSIKREPAPADMPDVPPGVSSNFMHDHVKEGTVLQVRAPAGDFVLRAEGKIPVVLLSGGVGCTPMISMLTAIADAASERDVWFVHGVRNGREHAFGDAVRELAAKYDNIHVHICYSQPDPNDVAGRDYDSAGHVSVDLLRDLLPGPIPQFFMCGSTPFMRTLYQGLIDWGVDKFQINYEFFGPACDLISGDAPAADVLDDAGDRRGESHQVTFKQSGITATWTPASGSLLELAEAVGINPDFVCRSGMCHTCLKQVAEGTFDYLHEAIMTPAMDDEILICSARPTSDLVLEI
jgi:uncharacterized protein